MKKVIVVGATGVIGEAIVKKLQQHGFDVVPVSRSSGISVDIEDVKSIRQMYEKVGSFDALVAATGKTPFKQIDSLTYDDWLAGVSNKLLGQIHLVQEGQKYISDNGSFTLTSGILNKEPVPMSTVASVANAGLEGYVKVASLALRNKARVNVVSPTVVTEALARYGAFFPGFEPVDVDKVANAYLKSIAGMATGEVYEVGY
ncbi:short chain dehydrogenase [Facilibium subflavum]|uniref:short chain dehydrogenase n=1 Tax=Facilibium subflavum TaxID=2219058 RepID=UPI000E64E1A0|nr:short chain dehydrogenase [Facilibium subflavum]